MSYNTQQQQKRKEEELKQKKSYLKKEGNKSKQRDYSTLDTPLYFGNWNEPSSDNSSDNNSSD